MVAMQNPIPFGQRLHTLLEGLQPPRSQAWLAEITGLERSTISRLIKGERNPTQDTVQCLAPVLGMSIKELIQGTDAEARLQEASQLVRREDYEAVVQKLVEYEGRLNELEMKVRAERNAREQDEQRRKQAEQDLLVARRQVELEQRSLDEVTATNTHLRTELSRYRAALHKAVAEISSQRAALEKMAEELKAVSKSNRTTNILAGIAAFTGVVTAASFLSSSDESSKDASSDKAKTKSSRRSQ